MEKLVEMQLNPDKSLLDAAQRTQLLKQLPQWVMFEGGAELQLVRQFKFGNFATALQFANRVAVLAEEKNHHPALLIEWGKVTVTWWTHSLGGLHINDFIMAAHTEKMYALN